MNAELFDEFTKYPESKLREFGVPEMDSKFLRKVGLPSWCAPNIHFGEYGEDNTLLPLIEVAGRSYLGLGVDRNDHPIAIDALAHSVWVVPESGEPQFVASNVRELARGLDRFQACVNAAVERDSYAFIQNRVPSAALEPFISWASTNCPSALSAGSFWHGVLMWLGVHNNSLQADGPDGPRA